MACRPDPFGEFGVSPLVGELPYDAPMNFSVGLAHRAGWLALLVLWVGCSTPSGVLRGTVVGLADGDTITVLDASKKTHKVRLVGIDAPERRQPFGTRSREHLSELVFQREVEVHWSKKDRYQRILGKVMVADPACTERRCPLIDVNLRQIEAGLAWWYRRYAHEQAPKDRTRYEEAERLSREAKRGLWAEADPVAPWSWRRPKQGAKPKAVQGEKEGSKRKAGRGEKKGAKPRVAEDKKAKDSDGLSPQVPAVTTERPQETVREDVEDAGKHEDEPKAGGARGL